MRPLPPMPKKLVRQVDHIQCGILVRNCRTDAGVSLRALARQLGLGLATMSNLENGKRKWTPERWRLVHDGIAAVQKRDAAESQRRFVGIGH